MQSRTAYNSIRVDDNGPLRRVWLARPDVHNAFNAEMIGELHQLFSDVQVGSADSTGIRAIVLGGEGKSFCAGADVNWMRQSLAYTLEENTADAARMAAMFRVINSCPVPVIARIQGAALGGGSGLAAVSDIVVAEESATFAFSEVKLGIAPAVISPFVLAKIGRGHARALFLTGERFGVERALRIGLAHVTAPLDELDAEVDRAVAQVLSSAPSAVSRAKELINRVFALDQDEATEVTVRTIAELRTGPEGQEGLSAFLERRKPGWSQ